MRYYLPNIRQNGEHKLVITKNNIYPILMRVTVDIFMTINNNFFLNIVDLKITYKLIQ